MPPMLDIQTHRDESFDHMVTDFVKPVPATISTKIPSYEPQPSLWKPLRHPRYIEVSKETDDFFLKHWKFPSAKAEEKFLNCDFSSFACHYFPLAKDDRIQFACRNITLLFLVDGKVATNYHCLAAHI